MGYAKVKITLINENDNRPIFSQPLYNVSLYENITVGTSVLTVLVSLHVHRGQKLLDIPRDTEHLGFRCPQVPGDCWLVNDGVRTPLETGKIDQAMGL